MDSVGVLAERGFARKEEGTVLVQQLAEAGVLGSVVSRVPRDRPSHTIKVALHAAACQDDRNDANFWRKG